MILFVYIELYYAEKNTNVLVTVYLKFPHEHMLRIIHPHCHNEAILLDKI